MLIKKKARIAILISDGAHIKGRKVNRDKEGHYIMINGANSSRRSNNS